MLSRVLYSTVVAGRQVRRGGEGGIAFVLTVPGRRVRRAKRSDFPLLCCGKTVGRLGALRRRTRALRYLPLGGMMKRFLFLR